MLENSSFKVGIYIRLSRDDGNIESDSIVSQRSLLNQYVKEILLNEQFTLSNEREEQIALLLKNKNLDIKLKKALVEKINFKFDKLDDLDIELLPLIFEPRLL